MILAIDTSGEFASIALLEKGGVPREWTMHSSTGHADRLFSFLEQIFEKTGVGIGDVECFAAAAGPGSFTGVRVALSGIKGLAEATKRPMVAVSNLQALAWHGTKPFRAPLIDARRGEIFGAVYDDQLRIVQPETVTKFPHWSASLPAGAEIVCAGDFPGVPATKAPNTLAAAVASIALERWMSGEAVDPAGVDANYVRRSDAELKWTDAG